MKSKKLVACLGIPLILVIVGLGLHACGTQQGAAPDKTSTNLAYPEAKLTAFTDHPELFEISGIVKSQTYQDVYWVHNDSGDKPRIFAINRAAEVLLPNKNLSMHSEKHWQGINIHNAKHRDWEDIAIYDGKLYIADMGNNGNARKDLGIYVFNEPQFSQDTSVNSATFIPVRYPDQIEFPAKVWHFDNEAFFIDDGQLFFLTKHRTGAFSRKMAAGSKLYRLDTLDPKKENTLTLISTHPDLTAATAADLSPGKNRLAVLSYTEIWIFEKPKEDSDDWLSGEAKKIPISLKQVEAITWIDDETLLFTNEQREVFEISLSGFL